MKITEHTQNLSGILPLSHGQRAIWMGQACLGESSPAYISSALYRIRGPVDAALLRRALGVVTRRNRTLRSFLRRGTPFPSLEPQEDFEPPFTFHDVSRLPDPASSAREILKHTDENPFALYDSPLCRYLLVKENDSLHYLLTSHHHIATDGFGVVIVFNEIAAAYNRLVGADDAELPEPVDYEEFLREEREYEAAEKFLSDHDFWKEHIEAADVSPLFSPLPGCDGGYGRSARLYRKFSPEIFDRLIKPAGEAGTTPTAALFAATALFFSRLKDRDRMVIGFPFLNRKNKRFRRVVGHFVNGLPLGVSLNPAESFLFAAADTAKLLRKVMRHAAYPVEEVVSELGIRSGDSGTVFRVSFNHLKKASAGRLGGAEVEFTANTNNHERHILHVAFWEINEGDGVEISLDYSLNYFTRESAETLLDRFVTFLARLAEAPDLPFREHGMLLPEEALNIDRWSRGPVIARSLDRCIHEVFRETAEKYETLPAVFEDNSFVNYGNLNRSANRVANALLAAGLKREEPVGVLARRSAPLAATMLGIWKAGGCYLPLDPEYPPERIRFIVEDAGVRILIAPDEPPHALPLRTISFAETQLHSHADPGITGGGSDLAYIIYTSGSTGTPKGVAIEHGGFLNMISGQIEFLSMTPEDRVLLFAPPCFDASLSEIFMGLLSGAALCPVGRGLIDAPWDLREYMARLHVSVATFPPSYLRLFDRAELPGLRAILTAGEPPNPGDARHYGSRLFYVNAYGPTENSVCSTMGRVSPDPDRPLTIGRPIPNVRTHILDGNLRPVPPGTPGELCLAGPGLARGYLNRPEAVAASFVRAPSGERIYRTGDLACWTERGEIEYLGRRDNQIKVRGYRVEPGEVESALMLHPGVLQSAVVATKGGGSCSLSAFVVPKPDAYDALPEKLRNWVAERLPVFMHPARIVMIESLPTNGSGKIDRRRLADLALASPEKSTVRAELTRTMSGIASIWEQALGESGVEATDNFFSRGGDSLLAIRVTQKINDVFNIDLPVRSLFGAPVLADLAAVVDGALEEKAHRCNTNPPLGELPESHEPVRNGPPSEAQRQLWVIQQIVDRGEVYNMPVLFDVKCDGAIDPAPWEEALRAVIGRHESLRTAFAEVDGSPEMRVLDNVPFTLELADCGSRAEAIEIATERVYAPFDPAEPPLLRAGLVRYAPDRAIFQLCLHHIIGDGESIRIIVDELAHYLSGGIQDRPASPFSSAVEEERRYLASERAAADRAWWLNRLAPPLPTLDLAPTASRPFVKQSAGARRSVRIEPETAEVLRNVARKGRTSFFSLMLALVKALIHKRTGARDIVVGIPGTTRARAEYRGSVGYYVNPLAVRTAVEEQWSFEELLCRVHASVADAFAHGDYPFARLYEDLGLQRDPSRSPVFDVMLTSQPAPEEIRAGRFLFRNVEFEVRAVRFDLIFTYVEHPDGSLTVCADFDTVLFPTETIDELLAQLVETARMVGTNRRTPLSGTISRPLGNIIDRAATTAPPATLVDSHGPRNGAGNNGTGRMIRLLAKGWQSALGRTPEPDDNFFALGGDSIKAIQVCSRLRAAGVKLSPREIFERPVLKDLAHALYCAPRSDVAIAREPAQPNISDREIPATPDVRTADAEKTPLTPIQRWLFEDHPEAAPSFLMNVLLTVPGEMDSASIETGLRTVMSRHDCFRLTFEGGGERMGLKDGAPELFWYERSLRRGESFRETLKPLAPLFHRRIDPGRGCHIAALLMRSPTENRLYLAVHHLVMDAVSWRIFLEELEAACRPETVALPSPTAPFVEWAKDLLKYGSSELLKEELPHWRAVCSAPSATLPVRDVPVRNVWTHFVGHTVELDRDVTQRILLDGASSRGVRPVEILLAGLSLALGRRLQGEAVTITLEGHGRESCISPLDVSRTLGWFTCRYPFRLHLGREDREAVLSRLSRDYRSVPNNGVDFGILQRIVREDLPDRCDLLFNYLGEFSTGDGNFKLTPEKVPFAVGAEFESDARLEFTATVLDGKLRVDALFHPALLDPQWVEGLLGGFEAALREFASPVREAKTLPLTPTQEGMFFQFLSDPESRTYTEQMSFTLAGPADPVRIMEAWRHVAARHESLRALFAQTPDGPVQKIPAEPPHVFAVKDLSGLDEEARKREAEAFLEAEKTSRLDIEKGPTFRAAVLRLQPEEHLLVWTFHHILMDGWCIGILLGETLRTLERIDANLSPALPPAPSVVGCLEWLQGKDREADTRYWKKYLDGFESVTSIPGALSAGDGPFEPRERTFRLNALHTRGLADLAASLGSTLSILLQAAWGTLLARHCNVKDAVFGVVSSGREAEVEEMERTVGVFIRTLPVRWRLESSEEPFSSVVARLQAETAKRLPHETLPLPNVQAASSVEAGLFDHILLFENYPVEGLESGRLKVADVKGFEQLPYNLGLSVVPGEALLFRFSHNERVYPSRLVEQIENRWRTLLDSILENPHAPALALPLLPGEERDRLIRCARDTQRTWPDARPFPALFFERAERFRDRIAIVGNDGDPVVTYGELAAKAERLARSLRRMGVGPEKPVAVCLERGSGLVSTLLAVMAAGAAYVPLDPSYPPERLRFMLQDSGAALVLADRTTASAIENAKPREVKMLLPNDLSEEDRSCRDVPEATGPGPDDVAYLIYTSGSTGMPKGVEVLHRGLANFLLSLAETPGMAAEDRVLALTTVCFDIHVTEIFLPLLTGARLVMASREDAVDGRRLANLIDSQKVTFVQATPASWNMLIEAGWEGENAVKGLVGGEPLPTRLARQLLDRCVELWNVYGPTETTVWSCVKRIEDCPGEPVVTIGSPIANTSVYILSDELDLLPDGSVGELCIGGHGLARGYRNRPELNCRQFVDLPFAPHERIYRTGDLAYRNPEGELVCLGRNDFQVKVRGYRIEPGEVETKLCDIPGVRRAVVRAGDFRGRGPELAAWITGGENLEDRDLHERLLRTLPHYMVPTLFVRVSEMPLTPNGKVDRNRLDVPAASAGEKRNTRPLTETERLLAGLWKNLLHVREVHPSDLFFGLGGHSLMAMRLAAAIEAATGCSIPVRTIFENPTLELQARYIDEAACIRTAGEEPMAFGDEPMAFDGLALSEEELATLRAIAGE